ncbi:MAG: hypothetical protein IKK45_07030 [Akkermansia sp.]|nr:hypothetical protein [Akkermansia sp.]
MGIFSMREETKILRSAFTTSMAASSPAPVPTSNKAGASSQMPPAPSPTHTHLLPANRYRRRFSPSGTPLHPAPLPALSPRPPSAHLHHQQPPLLHPRLLPIYRLLRYRYTHQQNGQSRHRTYRHPHRHHRHLLLAKLPLLPPRSPPHGNPAPALHLPRLPPNRRLRPHPHRLHLPPYGKVTANGDVEQPIQWSSEVYDAKLGMVYYNYRHYNPSDGRWTGKACSSFHFVIALFMLLLFGRDGDVSMVRFSIFPNGSAGIRYLEFATFTI